jgi:hypothetical protein
VLGSVIQRRAGWVHSDAVLNGPPVLTCSRRLLLSKLAVAASISVLAGCVHDKPEASTMAALNTARPTSAAFWGAYLNYASIPPAQNSRVWDTIGGSIGESYGPNENSCAARVSYGLDYGNAPIVPFSGASVNLPDHSYNGKPGDGKRYVVSAMKMAEYLRSTWGQPDHLVATVPELDRVMNGLQDGQCAILATPNPPGGRGHAAVLKKGYTDPFVRTELPVDVWTLP